MAVNQNRRFKSKYIVLFMMCLVIAFLLVIIAVILNNAFLKNADRTSSLLLDEVTSILEKNRIVSDEIKNEIKHNQIMKAKIASYMIEHGEISDHELDLNKIVDINGVDEINLISPKGIIIGGNNPRNFGLTMNDGESLGFFRPMLSDREAEICQELITDPDDRDMIYAAVWREDRKGVVQIGVKARKFLEKLRADDITHVVDNLPVIDGLKVVVAHADNGLIIASSVHSDIGLRLDDLGLKKDDTRIGHSITETAKGSKIRSLFTDIDGLAIGVLYRSDKINDGIYTTIYIIVLYLMIAGIIVYFLMNTMNTKREHYKNELRQAEEEKSRQFKILSSMSEIYNSLHLFNLSEDSVEEYSSTPEIRQWLKRKEHAKYQLYQAIRHTVDNNYLREAIKFTDLTTIFARMVGKKVITLDTVDIAHRWLRMSFITIKRDSLGYPTQVIFTTQIIDEEKKKEETLIKKSNSDVLTNLLNRRAYNDRVEELSKNPLPKNLAIGSLDVNGLKTVNDTLGHAAGDELLLGAVHCMRELFSEYGKIYRLGGDEFVVIVELNDTIDTDSLFTLFKDITGKWKGEICERLSVSAGLVSVAEFPDKSFYDLEKIADQRMYQDKVLYYQKNSNDRRAPSADFMTISASYLKIIKLNLTTDQYTILQIDSDERTADKGFRENVSEWLIHFGVSGMVYGDDYEYYKSMVSIDHLREYFKNGNKSLKIFYRRYVKDGFKKCMTEIIRDNEYTDENQTLFLFVKNIDDSKE